MKYYGKVGFWKDDKEVRPGVYKPDIEERPYTGDIVRAGQRWNSASQQNDNITVNNRISIIADVYLNKNLSSVRYLTYMGCPWKVNSIEINYPRIIFEIGGAWNGVDDGQQT